MGKRMTTKTAERIVPGERFTMDGTGNVYTAIEPPRYHDGDVRIACTYHSKHGEGGTTTIRLDRYHTVQVRP